MFGIPDILEGFKKANVWHTKHIRCKHVLMIHLKVFGNGCTERNNYFKEQILHGSFKRRRSARPIKYLENLFGMTKVLSLVFRPQHHASVSTGNS